MGDGDAEEVYEVELDDLSDEEWEAVQELAVRLLETRGPGQNVARICVEAYTMTLNMSMAPTPSRGGH